jgi:putative SOS response-associated peptidase YedK
MRHRRVLIAASGFYEWHRPPKDSKAKSTPYWITPKHGGIVAFGGLMETYMSADGAEIDTAAVLTTAANQAIAPIHSRMPVVIRPEDFARWLDCLNQEPRHVNDLMEPAPEDFFEAIRVSDLVNKVANSGPEVQMPATDKYEPPVPTKPARKPKAAAAASDQMKLF